MTARAILFATVAMLVFAGTFNASAGSKRGSSETGPLIMSGTMVPPVQASRARARSYKQSNKCVPVTLKRQPLSLLSLR